MPLNTTICALATPPGEGGIATVRISGPQSYEIAEKVFFPLHKNRSVAAARGYTALFGHYRLRGAEMDETVALFFRAPHSYTGEDVIELSVHGGSAMADGLLEALICAGAAPAGRGEFTRRALENGRMSLTQAEAVMEIISAGGRQGAALARTALDGTLARQIGAVEADLKELSVHLAAWIDYPEEDVPEVSDAETEHTLTAACAALEKLIDSYQAGAVLRHGVDCALVGRPNVGKSTLLNRLAGFDRAIVTPVAGTTRDVVEQAVMLGDTGIRLNLFDTAGVREAVQASDAIEAEGIRRSWKKLEECGLILAVFDASQPLTEDDRRLAGRCRGRAAIAILNKQDLKQTENPALAEELAPDFSAVLPLCANDAACLAPLCKTVAEVLGTARLDPGAAALCTARQLNAAVAARDALRDALQSRANGFGADALGVCLQDALAALCTLTGEDVSESVIDEVFSKFCVGK